jgi:AraC-like DNA-binding protein
MTVDLASQASAPLGLTFSVVQSRHALQLHNVHVLEPVLCKVVHGLQRVRGPAGYGVQIEAGQWLMLPAHQAFWVQSEPDDEGYLAHMLTFSQADLNDFYRSLPWDERVGASARVASCIGSHNRLDEAWQRLLGSVAREESPWLQRHLLQEVWWVLALMHTLAPWVDPSVGVWTQRTQSLLMSQPSGDWPQERVATHFGMSVPTLRRHLAQEGQSFRRVLDDIRMNHALTHVQTTRRNIEDIAHACGYASASRFSQRFRDRFGLTPRALRKTV